MVGKRFAFLLVTGLILSLAAIGVAEAQEGRSQQLAVVNVAAADGAECDGTIYARPVGLDSVEKLAWASQQIVAGTVTEQLPATWVYPATQQAGPPTRRIISEYVVRVDQRFRGISGDTVRVRRPGGTLDGCTQTNAMEPDFVVGQRRVLFLSFSQQTNTVSSYNVTGAIQGAWAIASDGSVTPDTRLSTLARYRGQSLTQIGTQVQLALGGVPPLGLGSFLVSLDQAPFPNPLDRP